MPDEVKKQHNNYLSSIKKLLSYSYGKADDGDIKYLRQKIQRSENIVHREWLLSRCNRLLVVKKEESVMRII
jgi:hypothetical protein